MGGFEVGSNKKKNPSWRGGGGGVGEYFIKKKIYS